MADEKTGGCAFPIGDSKGAIDGGMTLRDYFAAQALNGLLSNKGMVKAILKVCGEKEANDGAASLAFSIADAMLKVRVNKR